MGYLRLDGIPSILLIKTFGQKIGVDTVLSGIKFDELNLGCFRTLDSCTFDSLRNNLVKNTTFCIIYLALFCRPNPSLGLSWKTGCFCPLHKTLQPPCFSNDLPTTLLSQEKKRKVCNTWFGAHVWRGNKLDC